MTKKEILEDFMLERPTVLGAYGYGSAIFKQKDYNGKKPQYDMILIVDDLKKWHLRNMINNRTDYSFIGKVYLTNASIERIKGLNKIIYFSNIKKGNELFKYGVIEKDDFLEDLISWENVFLAGRFHKPTLEIKGEADINNAILKNRESAFIVSCILSESETTLRDLYIKLCGLSYLGDMRMAFAENPNKVENIVYGNFGYLEQLYKEIGNKYKFIQRIDDRLLIDHSMIFKYIDLLPKALFEFLLVNCKDLDNLDDVRGCIYTFFQMKNHDESIYQTFSSIQTNGIIRSVPYALSKISKKYRRK